MMAANGVMNGETEGALRPIGWLLRERRHDRLPQILRYLGSPLPNVERLAVWEAVEEGQGVAHPGSGSSRDGGEPTFDTAIHTPTLTSMATTPAWRFHSWLWPLASRPA